MPLDGSGTASKPSGTTAVSGATISSASFNSVIDDIYSIFNTARPVAYGGTGGGTAVAGYDGLDVAGADIATGSPINLDNATGPFVKLTGTTTVSAVTLASGKARMAYAAGAFQLTAGANLIVNGSTSVNYTTTAGDLLIFRGMGSSVVRVWVVGSPQTAAQLLTAIKTVDGSGSGLDADTLDGHDSSYFQPVTAAVNFSATKNASNQSGIANATSTKLTFTTEEWDNGSHYDAANSRWTPPAGMVRISAAIRLTGTVQDAAELSVVIAKNGTVSKQGTITTSGTGASQAVSVDALFQANGTDYFEAYTYIGGSGTHTIDGNVNYTYFQGELLYGS